MKKKIFIIILAIFVLLVSVFLIFNFSKSSNATKTKTAKEMYKQYDDLYPDVKNLYSELVDNVKETKAVKVSNSDEYNELSFVNADNNEINGIKELSYKVDTDDNKKVIGVLAIMEININAEDIKTNGFKFTETPLYKLSKTISKKDLDYSLINEKITDFYLGNGYENFTSSTNDLSEVFILNDSTIRYFITLKS